MSDPQPAADAEGLVFLYDVDNTLLNNDQLKDDADSQLDQLLGLEWSDTFWRIYEEVRQQEDVVDIPQTMRLFDKQCTDPKVCAGVHSVFDDVDFRHYLYPGALDALAHTGRLGTNVIVSDGDAVFQKAKIERSGLADAVGGNVLIFIHKEQHVAEITSRYPGSRYVMTDDKPHILKAMPPLFGPRLTTVFVLQGKYAHDPKERDGFRPDLILPTIGDMCRYSAGDFRSGHTKP